MPPAPHALLEVTVRPSDEAADKQFAMIATTFPLRESGATVRQDRSSRETLLGAQDELALDTALDKLRSDCGFELEVGAPQIAYRETLNRRVDVDHSYKRAAGPVGQFARVALRLEPVLRGAGFRTVLDANSQSVPAEYLPGVVRGLMEGAKHGPLAGFPLTDLSATLVDGAYHDVDSSEVTFAIAARDAVRKVPADAAILLEPVMRVRVTVPATLAEAIIADLNLRRVRDLKQTVEGQEATLDALVPLANLFGYPNILRGLTAGTGRLWQEYDHYAEVDSGHGPEREAQAAALRA